LRELDAEIKGIEAAIANYRRVKPEIALGEIREHVTKALLTVKESLTNATHGHFARAKETIARHVGKLVLTPSIREGRPVYRVTGNLAVAPQPELEKCRMQLVARDGIEL
jgi:hypothetical protein